LKSHLSSSVEIKKNALQNIYVLQRALLSGGFMAITEKRQTI